MQSAGQQCNCRALHRSRAQHLRPPQVFRRPFPKLAGRRQQACTCSAEQRCTCSVEQRHADLSRREALLAFGGAAAVALTPLPSSAEEGGPALLQAVTLGCTHHPHISRPEDCPNTLQKQRPCMAEPPPPPAMVAMEAMLRRLPSEAVHRLSIHNHSESMPGLQGPLLLSAGTPLSTQPPGSLTQSTRWAHTEAIVQCCPLAIAFMYAFAAHPTLL